MAANVERMCAVEEGASAVRAAHSTMLLAAEKLLAGTTEVVVGMVSVAAAGELTAELTAALTVGRMAEWTAIRKAVA